VLGPSPDWQDANAGHRFVTDAKGEAHFTSPGIVDRRWRMVPYGMTGLSRPVRADHILIAAELEQTLPTVDGKLNHFQWLHTFDIDCDTTSDCATSGITTIYTRDAKGRFTREAQRVFPSRNSPPSWKLPEMGELVLSDPGYNVTDFFLSQADGEPARKRWTVRFILQRKPVPVLR
jgi:hypothetical protein